MFRAVLIDVLNLIAVPLAALLVPIIAAYVILVLHKLAKKVGLQVTAEQELQTRVAVQNVILGIEELARARLKKDGVLTAGETKHQDVIALARARLPDKETTEITDLVNEELPKVRAALAPPIAPPVVAPVLLPTQAP